MPSKTAQLIAFLSVLLISVSLHRFVYSNLKRVLLRDYPKLGPRLVRAAMVLFVVMDSPFIFLYLRGKLHMEMTTLSRVLLYPFSVWQAVMILWAVILVPFVMWRRRERLGVALVRESIRKVRNRKDGDEPENDGADGFDEDELGMATE